METIIDEIQKAVVALALTPGQFRQLPSDESESIFVLAERDSSPLEIVAGGGKIFEQREHQSTLRQVMGGGIWQKSRRTQMKMYGSLPKTINFLTILFLKPRHGTRLKSQETATGLSSIW